MHTAIKLTDAAGYHDAHGEGEPKEECHQDCHAEMQYAR